MAHARAGGTANRVRGIVDACASAPGDGSGTSPWYPQPAPDAGPECGAVLAASVFGVFALRQLREGGDGRHGWKGFAAVRLSYFLAKWGGFLHEQTHNPREDCRR